MTDHNPLPMPNNGLCENVVFQPCGHRSLLVRDTIRKLGASDQLAAIDIGNQFSAVTLDSKDCTKCNPEDLLGQDRRRKGSDAQEAQELLRTQ